MEARRWPTSFFRNDLGHRWSFEYRLVRVDMYGIALDYRYPLYGECKPEMKAAAKKELRCDRSYC